MKTSSGQSQQSKKREHPTGPAFLGAIGIVSGGIARGTNSAIVDRSDAEITALPDDFGREINFIMWRPNARAEECHKVGGARTKPRHHRPDCIRDNAELGSLLPRMDKSDGALLRIDKVERATIRDVNTETDAGLIGHEAIAILETFVLRDRRIDRCDLTAMNLLSGDERHRCDTMFAPDLAMNPIESCEHLHLIMRHLDARDTESKPVNKFRERTQRRKFLNRKLTLVHLPDVVVRVVRVVVVLAGIGGRLPA